MSAVDDSKVHDAVVLGRLAMEMRPRMEAIEVGAVFAAAEHWPLSSLMPVKRCVGDDIETGFIRQGDGPVVVVDGTMPVGYVSFEAVAADGWRPD